MSASPGSSADVYGGEKKQSRWWRLKVDNSRASAKSSRSGCLKRLYATRWGSISIPQPRRPIPSATTIVVPKPAERIKHVIGNVCKSADEQFS